MKLDKVLAAVQHNIGYVEDIEYDYIGKVKKWEFNDINGDLVGQFLSAGQDVIQAEIYTDTGDYEWISPKKRAAYLLEERELYNLVDNADDFIDKIRSVVNLKDCSDRYLTPVGMTDDEFIKIAKMAHANDITFNEQLNKIVKEMAKISNYKEKLPVFGEKNATHTII